MIKYKCTFNYNGEPTTYYIFWTADTSGILGELKLHFGEDITDLKIEPQDD